MRSDPTHTPPPTLARPGRGFTLIELLVVIGIIALLIGLLIPMASRIRITGQRTATLSDINRLSQACEAYYSDFGAYPGVFSDNDVLPQTMPVFHPSQMSSIAFMNYPANVDGNSYSTTVAAATTVTSSENLMLSLLGGLSTYGGTPAVPPTTLTFDLATVGNGAASMNMNKPARSQAYLQVRPSELTTGRANFGSSAYLPGEWAVNTRFPTGATPDTQLPEMLDSYSNPQPILYMRAFRGNTGSINIATPPTTTFQYDVRQLGVYGFPLLATDVSDRKHPDRTFAYYYPASGTVLAAGAEAYFGNRELTQTSTAQIPLHKDGYLLISAGDDGFYGTADDLHN